MTILYLVLNVHGHKQEAASESGRKLGAEAEAGTIREQQRGP